MSLLSDILRSESPSLVRHAQLEPAAGPATPVAPAVYPSDTDGRTYRINQNAPVLLPDDEGFLFTNSGRTAPSVVISSVAGEATRAEPVIYHDPELYPWLPAVEITAPSDSDIEEAVEKSMARAIKNMPSLESQARRAELGDVLKRLRTSSWELSHRHIDSWVRYSLTEDNGKALWSQPSSDLYREIVSSEAATIAGVSLNSVIWGYWLASGATSTHRRARSISSQIIGTGASPSPVFATKTPGKLPASGRTRLVLDDGELTVVESDSKVKGIKPKQPSAFGLGAIITSGDSVPIHYTCESIASLTSVSLADLRALDRYEVKEPVIRAALGVSMLATELVANDGHIRSECDLVEIAPPAWGLRVRGQRGARRIEVDVDELRRETLEALEESVKAGFLPAAEQGSGARKIKLRMSSSMAQVVLDALLATAAKSSTDE
ncbi:type I-U CRISPR-associated protein Cas7 [Corynebacterium sp. 11A]|uniref:type I-G CRISPR-associated protein Cas7 n=1 Tax=Corynebacterium sp. 11A TaxID=2080510 RepID=UPI00124EE09F|nr:type I-U CRISPR-associated protein Cas7 [Corynebacterium sp. 11A]